MNYKEVVIMDDDMPISLCVCGDTVQTDSNRSAFESGEVMKLVGHYLFENFSNADVAVFNLEAPITTAQKSIYKPGAPCIASSIDSVNFFKNVPAKKIILSCANNHIKDYDILGISDTIKSLNSSDIEYIGISEKNKHEASMPVIIKKGKKSLALYACAENEFSIATEESGGANGYDPLQTFDDIEELSNIADDVLVLFHAGREHYRYPSPNLRNICHKMVDKGASYIICQHSHCVGCHEIYSSAQIVYGQGNFIFDRLKREEWKSGLVINIKSNMKNGMEFIPIESHDGCVICAEGSTKDEILSGYQSRSKDISNYEFVNKEWKAFCEKQLEAYCLQGILGVKNRWLLTIDRKTHHKLSKHFLKNRWHRLLLKNFIRCESIRESMLTILDDDFVNCI